MNLVTTDFIQIWHPDSPGMKVWVKNNWWNRRKSFASLRQVGQHYKRKKQIIHGH